MADCIGDRVPGSARGTVHSVFARACNIETRSGELVTLLVEELGDAPHGVRLRGPVARFDSWLIAGQGAILENAVLRVPDAGVNVDLAAAAVWCGTVASVSTQPCRSAVALQALGADLLQRAPQQGIAHSLANPANRKSSLEHAFTARLSQALPMLANAIGQCDALAAATAAADIVGLGPGLTPSGDDFVAGCLAALWSRAGCEIRILAMLPALGEALAPLFVRTNAISRQMLGDAAQGRFARRLVNVTIALASGCDVVKATAQALASGYSSGADALCGLLFGYAPDLLLSRELRRSRRATRFPAAWRLAAAPA